ncbi:Response regulator receiver domain-containing protein [Ensifer adhaerens]|nr:Response regulator receiver domain-containing protein [Ensifer adhaerens]
MTILIVEDNPTNGLILRHLMTKTGADEIMVCEDPLKALNVCQTQRFDVLIVDHMLPSMTGVEFVRLVRQLPGFEETSIVMVTADTSRELQEEALAAGVDTFLTKPIEALGFTHMMSGLLARRHPAAAPSI